MTDYVAQHGQGATRPRPDAGANLCARVAILDRLDQLEAAGGMTRALWPDGRHDLATGQRMHGRASFSRYRILRLIAMRRGQLVDGSASWDEFVQLAAAGDVPPIVNARPL